MPDGELITRWFPRGPYNFESVATDYPKQPLRSIFQAVEEALLAVQAVTANLMQQMTAQTATGVYLRNIAVLYGVTPIPGEADDQLRMRILAAINEPRITVPACQLWLQNWFDANQPENSPNVYVCDLQTDPGTSAEYGLVDCEFLVLMNWHFGIDDGWFLNYSYLDYTTWLGIGVIFQPDPSMLSYFMTHIKGAGFLPLWRNNVQYGWPEGQVGIADESSITVDG